ncbi:MAG TPA: hypothetical protein P5125_03860 [Kiritimatiellia bacterium]|nr:hypothetical protein [Kiritimatiellia bacterium]HOR97443.1 hypothetical protein [Kiritimatiellia bacterium]HPK36804.1 hypothetical protein [Kiritimatiellia bacterium]HPW75517.1 hypothetical protein [Kiritimatiellia bacterium]HRU19472.1 hypothetical protein [Kiritimatiellia bacterium]
MPFCGDYTEAAVWSGAQWTKHKRDQAKRDRADAVDRATLEALARETRRTGL